MNEKLMKDLNVMFGRLNGMHAALSVIAGSLPPDAAKAAASKLRAGTEHVRADVLALPVPDVQMEEMIRVMREMLMVLETADQSPR